MKSTRQIDLDELWRRRRAGARNIAGVSYQIAVTAALLTAGRSKALPISSVVPEGLEDIDCVLQDGSTLYVQVRERAGGHGTLAMADLAGIAEHAAPIIETRGSTGRLALVTDAELGSELVFTGWDESLGAQLPHGLVHETAKKVNGLEVGRAADLVRGTHIVKVDWDLGINTVEQLSQAYQVPGAVAQLVYGRLLEQLSAAAADQRHRTRATAERRCPGDLDALVRSVVETVNVEQLDAAVRAGIVEPLNFTKPLAIQPERFLAGVDVVPGHIAAGLDVPRPEDLAEILTGLKEDQYTLIVGQSGAGKSALLWRAAREAAGATRAIRLLRLRDADVPEFLRFVRLQEPSTRYPVLVCADNLGRPSIEGWPTAVDQLLEIPGVFLLGASRQEDFKPELHRARARIIEPLLGEDLAQAIAETLQQRGVELRLDVGEAFQLSKGLLMEFLYLLLEGRRLEDVVSAQAMERLAPGREVEREVLRHVCAAHTIGVSVSADILAPLTRGSPGLHAALDRLRKEHLIIGTSGDRWIGLHELRSEVITKTLHQVPPPTEGQTMASLLPYVTPAERRRVIVGAATRGSIGITAIADSAAEILFSQNETAETIAEILEALAEADAVRYAQPCIPLVEEMQLPISTFGTLRILYGMRHCGVNLSQVSPGLQELAQRLPDKPPSLRQQAVVAYRSDGSGRL